jgi:hypothetical protein
MVKIATIAMLVMISVGCGTKSAGEAELSVTRLAGYQCCSANQYAGGDSGSPGGVYVIYCLNAADPYQCPDLSGHGEPDWTHDDTDECWQRAGNTALNSDNNCVAF